VGGRERQGPAGAGMTGPTRLSRRDVYTSSATTSPDFGIEQVGSASLRNTKSL